MSFADAEVLPSACTWAFPAMGVMKENKGAVEKAKEDLKKAMSYLDQYLLHSTYLAGERITLADISVACTLLLPYRFVFDAQFRKPYQNVNRWFTTVVNQPNVAAVVGSVQLCEKAGGGEGGKGGKGGEKGGKKQEKKKEKAAPKEEEDEVLALPEMPKKEKDPFAEVPKGNFDMDDFKRFYSNNDEEKSIPYFWEKVCCLERTAFELGAPISFIIFRQNSSTRRITPFGAATTSITTSLPWSSCPATW